MKKNFLILFAAFMLLTGLLFGQQAEKLGPGQQREVINLVCEALLKQYVFPDVARKMSDLVKRNLKNGAYEAFQEPVAFAQKLTEDLRSVSRDRHLGVRFAPERIREFRATDDAQRQAAGERREKIERFENHGFREVKLLEGNVGYLKFNGFSDSQQAFRVAIGAMAFLANCDALIIDLRENGGGSPEMIQLLSSYFFDGEPRHLNSFYYRLGEKTEQYWTLPYVPGTKLAGTDLYILTSSFTFSGAEEFSYNMKNMKRATIVGETSGGGAHPVRMEILNDSFAIGIPYARAVNPVSGTNWEGSGVEPDVKVSSADAFNKAYLLALEKLSGKETNAMFRGQYQWIREGVQSMLQPVVVADETLRSYAGSYGPRRITFENGVLFYQRGDGPKMKMIPMNGELFRFDEKSDFRLRIVKKEGVIAGVEGLYSGGEIDFSSRD